MSSGKYLIPFLLLCLFFYTNSNLIGVDLGSEFFKATMLRPKQPFTMVENIQSKTKTPSAIAFKDDERTFGADAMAKKPKIPNSVLTFFNNYLEDAEQIKRHIEDAFISYNISQDSDRQTVEFKINFNKTEFKLHLEEVYGMIFRYIKFLADKFSGADIRDLVVTVPNHFDYVQRRRIVQAIQLSKLNLLSIVSENVAAAVHFSKHKSFNNTEYYIFYNMGSSYTQASLVSFLSKFEVKNNKTIETTKIIRVIDEAWDSTLGGNNFNYNLVRLIMSKFDNQANRKGKKSVTGDYKVAERILPSAVKYKEILSANKETPVNIIGVEGGMNVETRLTREDFEEVNKAEFERVYNPIDTLMKRAVVNLKKMNNDTELIFGWNNVSAVELIGGSIRVPKVQEVLRTRMFDYGNLIATHMNGDDSMALGAAFICANFSTQFKQPIKTELYHGPNYEVRLNLKNLPGVKICLNTTENSADPTNNEEECHKRLDKNTTLFKIRQGLDAAKTVSFRHDSDFIVELLQKFEGAAETKVITYTVKNLNSVLESMKADGAFGNNTLPKVNLRFKQDYKGGISLRVDASYESVTYLSLHTGPTGGQEVIFISNYTAPIPEEEIKAFEESLKSQNMTESQRKTLVKMRRDVGKKQTRDVKKDLVVNVEEHLVKPLTSKQLDEGRIKLDKFDEIDSNRVKTMETRNNLETYIYAKKEWLDTEQVKLYAKDEEEIKQVTSNLEEISQWYDDQAFSANFETLDIKLKEAKNIFKQLDERINKHKKRVKKEEAFNRDFKKITEEARNISALRPWAEPYYNNSFLKEVEAIQSWFVESKNNQDKLPFYDPPVLTAEMIDEKIKILNRELFALKAIPKPRPKIPENNLNIDDLMKNKTNLEDIMKKMNLTFEDLEKKYGTNSTDDSNTTNIEESESKPDL